MRDLPCLRVGVPEDEGGRGQDLQLVVRTAVPGEPALDVRVELPSRVEGSVPAEDRVGAGGGELPALVGVARLEDHRTALRAARHVEVALDVEVPAPVGEGPGPRVAQEGAGSRVGGDLRAVPGVEQLGGGGQELPGAGVAVLTRQESAAPEVLAGEGVPGGDHVPGGPALREVVERGELAGHLIGLVEGGVDGAGQAQALGHRGQGGEHREGVGPADHVQVVYFTALFTQPQPLREEEEVELGALGRLREVDERVEVDMAAGGRVAPHGGVVDAREVGREMDLLERLAAHGSSFRRVRVGRRAGP